MSLHVLSYCYYIHSLYVVLSWESFYAVCATQYAAQKIENINQSIKCLWHQYPRCSQDLWCDTRIGVQQLNRWSSSTSTGHRVSWCLWGKGQVKEVCLETLPEGGNWSGWMYRQREVVPERRGARVKCSCICIGLDPIIYNRVFMQTGFLIEFSVCSCVQRVVWKNESLLHRDSWGMQMHICGEVLKMTSLVGLSRKVWWQKATHDAKQQNFLQNFLRNWLSWFTDILCSTMPSVWSTRMHTRCRIRGTVLLSSFFFSCIAHYMPFAITGQSLCSISKTYHCNAEYTAGMLSLGRLLRNWKLHSVLHIWILPCRIWHTALSVLHKRILSFIAVALKHWIVI